MLRLESDCLFDKAYFPRFKLWVDFRVGVARELSFQDCFTGVIDQFIPQGFARPIGSNAVEAPLRK